MIRSQISALSEDITGEELTVMNSMLKFTQAEKQAIPKEITIAMAFSDQMKKEKA